MAAVFMACIPDDEIERLKKEIPLERLVKGFGVELKPTGANPVGRCLFHDDCAPRARGSSRWSLRTSGSRAR